MNVDELKAIYTEAVKIIRAERKMRSYVFRDKPEVMEAKLREIDRLLDILAQIKNALKEHIDDDYKQSPLIDIPSRRERD